MVRPQRRSVTAGTSGQRYGRPKIGDRDLRRPWRASQAWCRTSPAADEGPPASGLEVSGYRQQPPPDVFLAPERSPQAPADGGEPAGQPAPGLRHRGGVGQGAHRGGQAETTSLFTMTRRQTARIPPGSMSLCASGARAHRDAPAACRPLS